MNRSRPTALGVSALVHVAAIAGLVLFVDGRTGAEFKAPPTIELMLPPMAAAAASAVQPQQAEEIEAEDAIDAEDVPEVVEAVEPDPVPVPVMEDAVEAVEAPVVVAKAEEPEKPKPEEKPKPKPEKPKPRVEKPKKPKPKPRQETSQEETVPAPAATTPVTSDAPPKTVASAASAGAASVAGGGRPGAKADYSAQLQAWIERHKHYPDRLRSRNITGMPSVTFVIDREGNLVDCWVETTSGREALDKAAMRTIRRADPFPPPPPEVAALQFTVSINFQINK
ncbi:TonB family protein [Zavarzinia compransoris]|uniref:energy transducer TonB n=1 Tax=Zavarzinia marina TaxID=2911065 RepID=UPI001F23B0CD|nr:TonB family protein [Zavarzinia marina]MCF4166767.1 TonB family protein [Zavarzinia marina]